MPKRCWNIAGHPCSRALFSAIAPALLYHLHPWRRTSCDFNAIKLRKICSVVGWVERSVTHQNGGLRCAPPTLQKLNLMALPVTHMDVGNAKAMLEHRWPSIESCLLPCGPASLFKIAPGDIVRRTNQPDNAPYSFVRMKAHLQ